MVFPSGPPSASGLWHRGRNRPGLAYDTPNPNHDEKRRKATYRIFPHPGDGHTPCLRDWPMLVFS